MCVETNPEPSVWRSGGLGRKATLRAGGRDAGHHASLFRELLEQHRRHQGFQGHRPAHRTSEAAGFHLHPAGGAPPRQGLPWGTRTHLQMRLLLCPLPVTRRGHFLCLRTVAGRDGAVSRWQPAPWEHELLRESWGCSWAGWLGSRTAPRSTRDREIQPGSCGLWQTVPAWAACSLPAVVQTKLAVCLCREIAMPRATWHAQPCTRSLASAMFL